MKREDFLILILGLLLLAGMLLTFFLGGGQSRHGVGSFPCPRGPLDPGRVVTSYFPCHPEELQNG